MVTFTESCGDVFADLGVARPEIYERFFALPDDERLALEPIAEALQNYQQIFPTFQGCSIVANLMAAFAAVEAMRDWEKNEALSS